MTTIAVSNAKGGVAKSTTAINIGSVLASMGKRVLLIDMDKGDLTKGVGIDLGDEDKTIYEVLTENEALTVAIKSVTMEKTGTSYDVVPADNAMVNLDTTLRTADAPQYKLRKALDAVADKYDYAIVDCPPAIDAATINALTAADEVLVPALPHFYSMDALSRIVDTIEDVKESLNPDLTLIGVLLTNYAPRSKHHQAVERDIQEMFPNVLFRTTISSNIAVSESSYEGVDLYEYIASTPSRRHSKAATIYTNVTHELLEREEGKNNAEKS